MKSTFGACYAVEENQLLVKTLKKNIYQKIELNYCEKLNVEYVNVNKKAGI